MCEPTGCPDPDDLRELTAGQLDPDARQRIEEHLLHCGACRELLTSLDPTRTPRPTDMSTARNLSPPVSEGETRTFEAGIEEHFDLRLLTPSDNAKALGRLGKYDILAVEGCGGFGIVFRAWDTELFRTVAIKVLGHDLTSHPVSRRRFIREARAAAAISHPNVVTIYSVEDHEGLPFLVMEFVSGGSLREYIRRSHRLGVIETIRIATQVAFGLAAAHAQGVIHRDIKPANILMEDQAGRAKITDFGLARITLDHVDLTSRELAVGTPAYMSPEQVRGEGLDSRSDLFGLGCVIHAMLMGHSPFHGKNGLEIARRVAEFEPERLDVVDRAVPTFLADIVVRLLEKDPERRYQSAAEVAEALNKHLMQLNQVPSDELPALLAARVAPVAALKGKPRQKSPSERRRRGAWAAVVLLGAMALGALKVVSSWNRDDPGPVGAIHPVPLAVIPGSGPTITVAESGKADFRTIVDALAAIGPGGTIDILDGATYTGALHLDQAKHVSLTIQSRNGARLRGADDEGVINVGVPGVVLRGLTIEADGKQHGLDVFGHVRGLLVEDVKLEMPPSSPRSAVYLHGGAEGTEDAPIVLRRLLVGSGQLGIVLHGEAGAPVEHLRIEQCRLRTDTHMVLYTPAEDVHVEGNVFEGGNLGFSLVLPAARSADDVEIAANTFTVTNAWLGLTIDDRDQPGLKFHNNLVVEARKIDLGGQHPVDPPAEWFADNWWTPAGGQPTPPSTIARWHDNPRLDMDQSSPKYLWPRDGSPLLEAGAKCGPIGACWPGQGSPPR